MAAPSASLEGIPAASARLEGRIALVTDAGIERLGSITGLREVYLTGTKVTPDAVARFRQSHPAVRLISQ